MIILFQLLRCFNQRIYDLYIRHCRKFDGRIFPARPFHSDRAACDHHITASHIRLHAAAGSDPNKGIRPGHDKLLHRDRCRRAADACGGHTHLHPVQITGIGHIFPAVRHQLRPVKILCDLRAALRVSRQDHIFSHITFSHLDMILFPFLFRIIHKISHPFFSQITVLNTCFF